MARARKIENLSPCGRGAMLTRAGGSDDFAAIRGVFPAILAPRGPAV